MEKNLEKIDFFFFKNGLSKRRVVCCKKTAVKSHINDELFCSIGQNDISFCILNYNSFSCKRHVVFPRQKKMTCRFPLSSTSGLKVFSPYVCIVDPAIRPTEKHPSKHYFDPFKLQNFHKFNYFMIHDLKLLKKKNSKYENPNLKHKQL